MKTNEQKFKELIILAQNNGFYGSNCTDSESGEISFKKLHIKSLQLEYEINKFESLNDLVLKTNFFNCLFKDFTANVNANITIALYKNEIQTHLIEDCVGLISALKFKWVIEVEKGTALEWLFKQFNL